MLLYRLHNSLVAEIKKLMNKQSLGKIFRTASKVNDPKKFKKIKKFHVMMCWMFFYKG